MFFSHRAVRNAITATCALLVVTLCGCGSHLANTANSGLSTPNFAAMTGSVHGGQQPVAGAAISMYAASLTAYGGQARSMLLATVLTDAGGRFSLSPGGIPLYTCQPGDLVYLVAQGGNPGLSTPTNNANLVLMAALGPCSSLSTSTFISVNEVSTVAAVYALSPFASVTNTTLAGGFDVSHIGTSPTNLSGLQNAFASVQNLVSLGNGTAYGTTPAGNGTVSTAMINSLADVLATCINSDGGTACSSLKTTAAAPAADTYTAILTMARQPYANVAAILSLATPTAPFQPTAPTTSNDLTVYVSYTDPNLTAVNGMGLDAKGNVWVTNRPSSGQPALAQFSNLGVPLKAVTNILTAPQCLSIDGNQNIWVTNDGEVDEFTSTGAYLGSLLPTLLSQTKLNFCATDINNNFYASLDHANTNTYGFTPATSYYQFKNNSPATAPVFISPVAGYSVPVDGGSYYYDSGVAPIGLGNPVADTQGNIIFVDFTLGGSIDRRVAGAYVFSSARYRAFNAGQVAWTYRDEDPSQGGPVTRNDGGVQFVPSFTEFSVPVLDRNSLMVLGSERFGSAIGVNDPGDSTPGYDRVATGRQGHVSGLQTSPAPGSDFAFQYIYLGATGKKQVAAANHLAVSGTNQYFGSHTVNTSFTDFPYIVWETATGSAANGFAFTFIATPTGLLPNNMGQARDIAIDGSGNVWVNSTPLNNTSIVGLFEIIGVASPTITPYGAAIASQKIGQLP